MDYPQTKWRLLYSPAATGAWNMAVDEAILEACGRGEVPATLRLYAWSPPCVSLGYAQRSSEVDYGRITSLGWQVVRRPTGGRAILHTDELTYSVIGPHSESRLSGSVLESYQRLSQALLFAVRSLGLPAEAAQKPLESANRFPPASPQAGLNGPVCFEVPSSYEITVQGKKLIGSAQARRKEGVLQHGSLPILGDLGRVTEALSYADEAERWRAARRLLERAATMESIIGVTLSWQEVADAFVRAFQEVLNIHFCPAGLTPSEERRAAILVAEKYEHAKWTRKV